MKGVAENFSDLVARIQEINEHTRGLIASSLSHISNSMNDIHSLFLYEQAAARAER